MRTLAIRIAVVIVAVVLQASFFNLVLSRNLFIDLLPLLVLAWVIMMGFEKIWPWVVALGIFADLIYFERVGVNVIFFISIAYGISFFSRRFMIERRLAGFLVTSLFVIISFVFLDIGRLITLENFSFSGAYESLAGVFLWKKILFQSVINILFFYVVYYCLTKIEKNIENYDNKIKVIS